VLIFVYCQSTLQMELHSLVKVEEHSGVFTRSMSSFSPHSNRVIIGERTYTVTESNVAVTVAELERLRPKFERQKRQLSRGGTSRSKEGRLVESKLKELDYAKEKIAKLEENWSKMAEEEKEVSLLCVIAQVACNFPSLITVAVLCLKNLLSHKKQRIFYGEVDSEEESDEDSVVESSDEEDDGRDKIKNGNGKVVDKVKSEAQIKRGELGRQSDCIKDSMARVENGGLLSQVLASFGEEENFDKVNVVNIWVKPQTVKTPSRRNPTKTTTRLYQVRPRTKGAKPLSCFEMTELKKIVKLLEFKADDESEALFHFNGRDSKESRLITRLKSSYKFQMVWSMETDASGSNKGWHDLSKEDYREDMVWLFGHRFLDVEDPDKVALIKGSSKTNRKWSFKDL